MVRTGLYLWQSDRPGIDDAASNALTGIFNGDLLGEGDRTALGCRIRAEAGHSDKTEDTSNIDDCGDRGVG